MKNKRKFKRLLIKNSYISSLNSGIIGMTIVLLYQLQGLIFIISYRSILYYLYDYIRLNLEKKFNKIDKQKIYKNSFIFEILETIIWNITILLVIINPKLCWLFLISQAFSFSFYFFRTIKNETVKYILFKTSKQRLIYNNFLNLKVKKFEITGTLINIGLIFIAQYLKQELFIYRIILTLYLLLSFYDLNVSKKEYELLKESE